MILRFYTVFVIFTRVMSEYTVAPLVEEDVDDVMDLLKRTFFIDEPMNKAVGLYDNGSCPELEGYCRESMLEGYSFKAVNKEGKIVGVIISGVCPIDENSGHVLKSQAERCENLKFKRILYVLSRREEGARLWEKYPEEKTLVEIKVAATDPAWRKKGIMNILTIETEKLIREKKIKLLRLDTSSAYSAMVAEKMGYTRVYNARYADMLMDGEPLVLPEPPHINDSVYIKVMC